MTHLLIDNSNTVTKFILGNERELLGEVLRIETAQVTPDQLAQITEGLSFHGVCVSSVVPNTFKVLADFFKETPLHQVSHLSDLPLGIDYPKPAQIGADRLANAAAVFAKKGAPSIVIDFGTAVTFDVIGYADQGKGEPAYLGGVIAPGLASMAHYLSEQTALLPRIEIVEPPSAIGKTTSHAMQVGAVIGYRGLVREIISDLKNELAAQTPAPSEMVATGGHSALIAEHLAEIGEVDPLLTLEGIRLIAQRNL